MIPINKKSDLRTILQTVLNREIHSFEEIDKKVEDIIHHIKENGDQALKEYTLKFDEIKLENIQVSEMEIEQAIQEVDESFLKILKEAQTNILDFHRRQKQESWVFQKNEQIMLGQMITPIERIGIYVPGGKAAYPSTVLMNAIPASVAGVRSIAMVTPPNKEGKINPYILAAAKLAGIHEIYKIGGAQSIAALAYGTESILPVNKIVGPGNIYVARAKKKVFGKVDIDMIAGPSEVCIIADQQSNPRFIAADLLSQAEHDELASAILITPSIELARKVTEEVELQMKALERVDIIKKSIDAYGVIFITEDMDTAVAVANELAPEHLELMIDQPFELLPKVKNAGAIFLGAYSPEPLGDYFAGPNHTLPTSGTAKFSSPLGVYDFMKKSSIIYYGQSALGAVKDKIMEFAKKEGLNAHANSIKVRF
jgi:histidinol dehydrogenase